MKIYFDMDGVLADFDRGIEELCGIPKVDQENTTKEKDMAMWAAVRKVEHFKENGFLDDEKVLKIRQVIRDIISACVVREKHTAF